ncbi:uncharacterized protein PAC_09919 [Phialocephala subalpina]|uniref:Uncharacterized protein n=1 Tax=Phialocephala subalpina TaxID=576137 RepID=A0A1L7X4S2_9HELO|nr:uncharacterized protein PAC_09919 [Phialocephala subalpina]
MKRDRAGRADAVDGPWERMKQFGFAFDSQSSTLAAPFPPSEDQLDRTKHMNWILSGFKVLNKDSAAMFRQKPTSHKLIRGLRLEYDDSRTPFKTSPRRYSDADARHLNRLISRSILDQEQDRNAEARTPLCTDEEPVIPPPSTSLLMGLGLGKGGVIVSACTTCTIILYCALKTSLPPYFIIVITSYAEASSAPQYLFLKPQSPVPGKICSDPTFQGVENPKEVLGCTRQTLLKIPNSLLPHGPKKIPKHARS